MPQYVHTNNSSFAIPYNGSWAHLSYFLNAGHTTRKWVRDGGFDILHLHEPETPSLSHKPLVMHDAPPMVATFHASIEPYPRALRLFTRYLRKYLSPLREAIFVSESAQKTAEHYLPQQVGVQTIPNGIECDFYRRAEPNPQWQGSPEAPTIGFLGRMGEERKGFTVFAQAAKIVHEAFPSARFLVAGDGQEDGGKTLDAIGADKGLRDRFEFLGRVSDADKARFYRSLSMYVAPQTGGESFGIVLAEAMAAGCPVIASDLDAFRAVTEEGSSAALFVNRDANDCARRMTELIEDPARRQSLSQAGSIRSRSFDWNTVVDEVLEVYAKALS